jgi:DNA-directed RNA polymerase specialized sigma subunit
MKIPQKYIDLINILVKRHKTLYDLDIDLLPIANKALLNAYYSFDPNRGATFETFAKVCIINALDKHTGDKEIKEL